MSADPDARRGSGEKTPLFLAVGYEHGDRRIAELLLDRGADVHARDAYGRTPLHDAASGRDEASLALLLDRGADANLQDKRGETPLHVAARRGEESHIRVLLRGGADIDARDVVGRTPLHYAAGHGRLDETTYLVGRGADVSIRDQNGQTSLDHMRANGIADIRGAARRESFERLLAGFMTVKVVEARPDSLVVQVESLHSIYPEAEWRAQERGTFTVPCAPFRDVHAPGDLIRCQKGLSLALDEAWSHAHKRDIDIEQER
jgi:ankyrin repeat protein